MSYTIRQWMSADGCLWDETETAGTADETISKMRQMCGVYRSIVSETVADKVRNLEPGEMFKIKSSAAKITIRVKRLKK